LLCKQRLEVIDVTLNKIIDGSFRLAVGHAGRVLVRSEAKTDSKGHGKLVVEADVVWVEADRGCFIRVIS
jgi:hypothetical protein